MSRQRRNFSAKFKSDLVIELLKGEKDLNTLATENNIQPNLLRNWKKEFLNNASAVFDDKREENLKDKYIKEEYPMRYKSLVRFGELEERANEVNETAYELLDDIEAKWLKKHKPKNPNSFTEQLQLRTQTRMMAEEIVIMDVVMQFH